MGMTSAELASKLGLTRQAISKLARRGMPLTSVEAAQQWRATYAPPRKSYVVAKADKAATPFQDALSRVERARACEDYFYQTLREAAEARDLRLTAKVGKDFLIAATRAAEAEQAAVAAGLQTRELIRTRDIIDEWNSIVQPFFHRVEMAEKDEKCRWYVTVASVAEEMKNTLMMFARRLAPRDLFANENQTEKA